MGRLIDADVFGVKVIKEKRFVFQWHDMLNEQFVFETVYGDLAGVIMDTPTAYDLDKVVEQLEEFREEAKQFGADGMLTDIIDVVKRGGIHGKDD